MSSTIDEKQIVQDMKALVAKLRELKPGDRSSDDRHYAMVISQQEIAMALFVGFILSKEFTNE